MIIILAFTGARGSIILALICCLIFIILAFNYGPILITLTFKYVKY